MKGVTHIVLTLLLLNRSLNDDYSVSIPALSTEPEVKSHCKHKVMNSLLDTCYWSCRTTPASLDPLTSYYSHITCQHFKAHRVVLVVYVCFEFISLQRENHILESKSLFTFLYLRLASSGWPRCWDETDRFLALTLSYALCISWISALFALRLGVTFTCKTRQIPL